MQQIKEFFGGMDLTKDVNDWLKENSQIRVINIFHSQSYDLYYNNPQQICNQWCIVTVLYECEEKVAE